MAINNQTEKVVLEFDSDFMDDLRLVVSHTFLSGKPVTVEKFLEIQVSRMVERLVSMIHEEAAGHESKNIQAAQLVARVKELLQDEEDSHGK